MENQTVCVPHQGVFVVGKVLNVKNQTTKPADGSQGRAYKWLQILVEGPEGGHVKNVYDYSDRHWEIGKVVAVPIWVSAYPTAGGKEAKPKFMVSKEVVSSGNGGGKQQPNNSGNAGGIRV